MDDCLRVLVVEDDAAITELLKLVLDDEGFVVEVAENGAVALEVVAQTPPHVIVLDWMMPMLDGIDFAALYQQTPRPHAPIILLTAARDADEIADEIQADALLRKPFEIDDLVNTVKLCMCR
jgi:two-component system, OmpR family, response regulator VicR